MYMCVVALVFFFYHVCALTCITLRSTKPKQLKVYKFDARLTHMKHNFNKYEYMNKKKKL